MTGDQAIQEARRIHAALVRNSDDVHLDQVDWETFETRNRALWDQAEADPRIKSMVLGLIRRDPNWKEDQQMSKEQIADTMMKARQSKRAKKTAVAEPPAEITSEIAVEVQPQPRFKPRKVRPLAIAPDVALAASQDISAAKSKATREKSTTEEAPKEDLVVFAFRLKVHERDLIHKAAGAAKASRFVRALTVAASMGDEKTVVEIVRAVKQELASAQ